MRKNEFHADKLATTGYDCLMSFSDVLQELPALTIGQRQILLRRVLELDDPPLSESEDALVESRLAAHRANPESSLPLEKMKRRLRSRSKQ